MDDSRTKEKDASPAWQYLLGRAEFITWCLRYPNMENAKRIKHSFVMATQVLFHEWFPTIKLLYVKGDWMRSQINICPVGWGCKIHRLLLCRGVRPPPNECPGYDTKQSVGAAPKMLELWGKQSTLLLPLLPGPLWPGVVAPHKGPIHGLNRTKPWFLEFTVFCI